MLNQKKLLRPLDFIFFMRPVILIPLWSFILIGYYHSNNSIQIDKFFQHHISFQLIIKSVLSTFIVGTVYIINQIFDRKTDALNKKLFFIPKGIITPHQAKWQSYILVILFVAGSIIFKLDWYYILFNMVLLLLGICYSMPPFQFKSRPGFDLLLNMIGYGGLSFFIGWTADKSISHTMLLMSLPYFLFMAAMYINTTMIDYEGDKDSGLVTTGVFLGKNLASLISLIVVIVTLVIGYLQKNWIIFSIVGLSSPLFAIAWLKKERKNFLLSVQIPGWLFVIFLGILYPYFFLLIVCLYLLTKFYYKQRFNINYPRIGEEKQTN